MIANLFRRRPEPVQPTPPISRKDAAIKTVWGLTLTEWNALSDDQRRWCRDHVATAQHNQEGTR